MNEFVSKLTIEDVLDCETGEIIKSQDFFKQPEDKLIHFRRIQQEAINDYRAPKFICPFCYQTVKISGKATARGMVSYFAHLYDSDECEIKTNGNYSKEEIEALKYDGTKESQRHIDLKEQIYRFLNDENSRKLNIKNVKLEERFKSNNPLLNWRRPDIYAEYNNRKVVFELQLSTTFLSVIVARDNFYKQNSTHIIWIFNFSDNIEFVNLGNLMCKDIYYANKRNAFILDNEAIRRSVLEKQLVLLCIWFEPLVIDGKFIGNEQKKRYITLSELYFDDTQFKPYYTDADSLFLTYNPEQLVNRINQEAQSLNWLKIVEEKAVLRKMHRDELQELKIKQIKNDLLTNACKLRPVKINGKWGYKANNEIIVPPIYDLAHQPDEDGYLKIVIDGRYGYLDPIGRQVTHLRPESNLDRGHIQKLLIKIENRRLLKEFGLYKWIKNGLTGITDNNEKEVIPFIYDDITKFSNNGMAGARIRGKWGCITNDGKEVIPFVYDEFLLIDSNAKVMKNNLWGIISLNGDVITPCIYHKMFSVKNSLQKVKLKDKWGYLDNEGNIITKIMYDEIGEFDENIFQIKLKDKVFKVNGLAKYIYSGKRGYVDMNGKEYWQYWKDWDTQTLVSNIELDSSKGGRVGPTIIGKISLPVFKKNN